MYSPDVYQRALEHHRNGRLLEAIADYDAAIAQQNDHAGAHSNRGAALAALERNDEALASFTRAVALNPSNANMLSNLGMALGKLRRYAQALKSLNRALDLAPDNADGHHNRGIVLAELGQHGEALQSFNRAIALAPNFMQAHHSRGLMLGRLEHFEEALASYDRVVALAPNFALAHYERSRVLNALGRYAEALQSLDRASALDPEAPATQLDKGMALLRLGDYAKGLTLYESRWRPGAVPAVTVRHFTQPPWRGEPLIDKTLLLHAEQGLGDSLQMLRYLPLVKARVTRILLEMPKTLHAVLGASAEGITVIEAGQPLPPFDLHCGLMSLPFAFGTRLDTIPAQVPYLTAPPERLATWSTRLPRAAQARVALVWSAGSLNPHGQGRSIALESLAPLFTIPGLTFVSLQVEFREQDLPALARLPIERLDADIRDFGDTAAAIAQCDLVITVDTSVAHLVGALGKPLWVLLHYTADWRWLLEQSASPWYPSARLFRQGARGEWDGVVTDVATALSAWSLQNLYQRGLEHQRNERLLEAIADYDALIARQPDHAEAYNNRGAALCALNRDAEALASFTHAVALKPSSMNLLTNRGMILGKLNRHAEALEVLDRVVTLAPDVADGHHLRGITLARLGHPHAALESFDRASALTPNAVPVHHQRGLTLGMLDRFEEALVSYDRVITLAPNFARAHHERGKLLTLLGRYAEGLESFSRASALDPRTPVLQFDRGLSLLRLGDYANGLTLYEWRWLKWDAERGPQWRRQLTQPQWCGETAQDKTLLLHAEQGLGDSLQMLRYLPLVKAKAARIILELPKTLHAVLGTIAAGITVVEIGQPLPSFDLHCALMSLPFAFGTRLDTIPAQVPYLTPPPARLPQWNERLPRSALPRVGLVWSASSHNPYSSYRSMALERLAPLFNIPGLTFVSLQVEYNEQDLPALARLPIERLDAALTDFGDTAAAIACCDLVISVDTSIPHLVGALGKPLWLLLPYIVDWRWLLERSDSPWYPTARLFRQSSRGDWDSVITDVATALSAWSLQNLYQRGLEHQRNGRLLEAIADYDALIARQPDHAKAHNNRGAALCTLNRDAEALASFTRAVALKPDHVDLLTNLGMTLAKLNHYAEALESFDHTIALAPNAVHAHHQRGLILGMLDRFEEALVSYDRVITLAPYFAKALHERGKVLTLLGRYAEGLENYNRASALDPHTPVLQVERGIALLRLGDYANGFALYEWRWREEWRWRRGAARGELRPFTQQQQWRGETAKDKTLLLHAEQGLGDSIQMLRFVPLVKAKIAHIILAVPKALHAVLGSIADGLTVMESIVNDGTIIEVEGQPPLRFDLQCGLMSLPFALGTRLDTIPAHPYLTIPHERLPMWKERLPRSTRPRVGLVWSSGAGNASGHYRSLVLERLAPLFNIPGLSFVSLQAEYREQDLPALARLPIGRVDTAITDFGDTAAAIAQCDLVISVDTAVAHLAGALGKPVWVLLSYTADWRWLAERTDSPWYPTARLFRQNVRGDWDGLIAAVAKELSVWSLQNIYERAREHRR
ncbi:MAG: tetratricopeptide repeat protein, partial [Pseudomonadales bacterium]|nr:tetratricopeptide repeat protein [Pseudomonadales bacterium]